MTSHDLEGLQQQVQYLWTCLRKSMDLSKNLCVGVKHWFSWCQWEYCRFGLCQTPHYCFSYSVSTVTCVVISVSWCVV